MGFMPTKTSLKSLWLYAARVGLYLDDGLEKTSVQLDNPAQGLLIESGIWREMYDFSEDCVLMVLASRLYDESDYIRNYEEFLKNSNKEMR